MIRWVFVIFAAQFLFYILFPAIERLGVGRLPGDIRFRLFRLQFCLPFGSTILWSAIAILLAQLAAVTCAFC